MKTRNYIAGSLTPLALAVAISTALADTAANTMSPAPAMTPPAGPVAGTAGTMPEPAPVAPPAPGPSDATFSSAALSSGQSALPLVAVPAVASAGLADTRNAASANSPELSLDDVVGLALQNNPTPKAMAAAVRAAIANIGVTKASGGPQVNFSGSEVESRGYGNLAPSAAEAASIELGGGSVTEWNSQMTGTVSVNQSIYSGGRVKHGKRLAVDAAKVQLAAFHQAQLGLVEQTILSYLTVLQNQELLTVAESNLSTSVEERRVAGVRFDAGAAARLEVLQADSALAAAQQQRIVAANDVAVAVSGLNILMGREPETPVKLASFTTLVLPDVEMFPLGREATAIANGGDIPTSASLRLAADRTLPSLEESRDSVEEANENVKSQQAQHKPNLSIPLSDVLLNPTSTSRFLLSVGLSLTQTIFDSGRITNQIRVARDQVEEAKYSLASQELQTANSIESALLGLDSARKSEGSADTAVLSAQEALRATQLGYEAGTNTALDVISARNAVVSAQTNAVNARFSVAQAQVQLASATSQLSSSASGAGTSTSSTSSSPSGGTTTVSTTPVVGTSTTSTVTSVSTTTSTLAPPTSTANNNALNLGF